MTGFLSGGQRDKYDFHYINFDIYILEKLLKYHIINRTANPLSDFELHKIIQLDYVLIPGKFDIVYVS